MRAGTAQEGSFAEREGKNLDAKHAIAAHAVQLIHERDTLLLDASTTAFQLARLLPDLELTVVTNSVRVVVELAGRQRISVMALGGLVRGNSLSFVGPVAERNLRSFRVDRAFLSCKGLTQDGVYESNEMEAELKRLMMDCANQVVLLADSEKIGQTAFALIDDLGRIDLLVTDASAPTAFTADLAGRNIEVVVVSGE